MLQQLEIDVVNFNAGGSGTRHDTNDAVYRHDHALLHHVAHIGHACAYSRQLEQAAAAECLDPGDTPTSCLTQRKSRALGGYAKDVDNALYMPVWCT